MALANDPCLFSKRSASQQEKSVAMVDFLHLITAVWECPSCFSQRRRWHMSKFCRQTEAEMLTN
jgi:hypothetical protein